MPTHISFGSGPWSPPPPAQVMMFEQHLPTNSVVPTTNYGQNNSAGNFYKYKIDNLCTVKSECKGHAYKGNPAPGDDSFPFGWPYSSYSQILSAVRESLIWEIRLHGTYFSLNFGILSQK